MSIFKVFISTIKFSRTERFVKQHEYAIKSKNNPYLHLLPHVQTFVKHDFEF